MFNGRHQLLPIFTATLLAFAPSTGLADIVSWHASSGLLPSDPSIPPEFRFAINGDPSWLTFQDDFLHIADTDTVDQFNFQKSDISPIASDGSWAFQIEIRMNSHSSSTPNVGATTGISDIERLSRLLIAADRIGMSDNAGGFVPGSLYFADFSDSFHVIRGVKTADQLHIFVDNFDTPVTTLAYAALPLVPHPSLVDLVQTSNPGVADLDVRSFAFNLNGTNVPEPSTALLLLFATGSILSRRRRA